MSCASDHAWADQAIRSMLRRCLLAIAQDFTLLARGVNL